MQDDVEKFNSKQFDIFLRNMQEKTKMNFKYGHFFHNPHSSIFLQAILATYQNSYNNLIQESNDKEEMLSLSRQRDIILEFLRELYKKIIREEQKKKVTANIIYSFLSFLIQVYRKRTVAYLEILNEKNDNTRAKSLREQQALNSILMVADETFKHDTFMNDHINVLQIIEYDSQLEKNQSLLEECVKTKKELINIVSKNYVNLIQFREKAQLLLSNIQILKSQLIKSSINNEDNLLLKEQISQFILYLQMGDVRMKDFIKKNHQINQLLQVQNEKQQSNTIVKDSIYNTKRFSIAFITLVRNIGQVTGVSDTFEKMFDFSKQEIINKNINIIIPPVIANKHQMILNGFVKRGANNHNFLNFRFILGQNKRGFLIPLSLKLKIEVVGSDDFGVSGIFRKVTDRCHYLMISESFKICGISEAIYSDIFSHSYTLLETKQFNINKMIPLFLGIIQEQEQQEEQEESDSNEDEDDPEVLIQKVKEKERKLLMKKQSEETIYQTTMIVNHSKQGKTLLQQRTHTIERDIQEIKLYCSEVYRILFKIQLQEQHGFKFYNLIFIDYIIIPKETDYYKDAIIMLAQQLHSSYSTDEQLLHYLIRQANNPTNINYTSFSQRHLIQKLNIEQDENGYEQQYEQQEEKLFDKDKGIDQMRMFSSKIEEVSYDEEKEQNINSQPLERFLNHQDKQKQLPGAKACKSEKAIDNFYEDSESSFNNQRTDNNNILQQSKDQQQYGLVNALKNHSDQSYSNQNKEFSNSSNKQKQQPNKLQSFLKSNAPVEVNPNYSPSVDSSCDSVANNDKKKAVESAFYNRLSKYVTKLDLNLKNQPKKDFSSIFIGNQKSIQNEDDPNNEQKKRRSLIKKLTQQMKLTGKISNIQSSSSSNHDSSNSSNKSSSQASKNKRTSISSPNTKKRDSNSNKREVENTRTNEKKKTATKVSINDLLNRQSGFHPPLNAINNNNDEAGQIHENLFNQLRNTNYQSEINSPQQKNAKKNFTQTKEQETPTIPSSRLQLQNKQNRGSFSNQENNIMSPLSNNPTAEDTSRSFQLQINNINNSTINANMNNVIDTQDISNNKNTSTIQATTQNPILNNNQQIGKRKSLFQSSNNDLNAQSNTPQNSQYKKDSALQQAQWNQDSPHLKPRNKDSLSSSERSERSNRIGIKIDGKEDDEEDEYDQYEDEEVANRMNLRIRKNINQDQSLLNTQQQGTNNITTNSLKKIKKQQKQNQQLLNDRINPSIREKMNNLKIKIEEEQEDDGKSQQSEASRRNLFAQRQIMSLIKSKKRDSVITVIQLLGFVVLIGIGLGTLLIFLNIKDSFGKMENNLNYISWPLKVNSEILLVLKGDVFLQYLINNIFDYDPSLNEQYILNAQKLIDQNYQELQQLLIIPSEKHVSQLEVFQNLSNDEVNLNFTDFTMYNQKGYVVYKEMTFNLYYIVKLLKSFLFRIQGDQQLIFQDQQTTILNYGIVVDQLESLSGIMINNQKEVSDSLYTQLYLSLFIMVFISLLFAMSIFPLQMIISSNSQRVLKFFSTFSPDILISMHMQINQFVKSLRSTKQNSASQKLTLLFSQSSIEKKRSISETNEIWKLKKIHSFISLSFFLLIITYPVINFILSYTFIDEQLQNVILLGYKKMFPSSFPEMHLDEFLDTTEEHIILSQLTMDELQTIQKKQHTISRQNQQQFDSFVNKIMEENSCSVLVNNPSYFDSNLDYNSCASIRNGVFLQGLIIGLHDLFEIFPQVTALYKIEDPIIFRQYLTSFQSVVSIVQIDDDSNQITSFVDGINNFILEESQRYFDLMQSIQLYLLIYQIIVLALVFYFGRVNLTNHYFKEVPKRNQVEYLTQECVKNMSFFIKFQGLLQSFSEFGIFWHETFTIQYSITLLIEEKILF